MFQGELPYTFTYTPADREQFRSGDLAREWQAAYPKIFSELDLSIALNQPLYHFCEWFTAVKLFAEYNYLSCVESYQFRKHADNYARFLQLVPPEIVDLLGKTQCPDLQAYREDESDWFFVEVKGPGDRIRQPQQELFNQLHRLTGKPVRIAYVREGA